MSGKLDQLKKEFTLTPRQVGQIAADFCQAMENGLAGRPGSLKMLPSFLAKPTGDECGEFLALDFGGSNLRALNIALLGGGKWLVRQKTAAPLKDPQGRYDLTAADVDAGRLFDFVAGHIAQVAEEGKSYSLGHTFSFPCRQHSLNQAVLINWTKEIKATGVEGREINGLLAGALNRRLPGKVKPRAVINDTVGTLLAAAYGDPDADIGSICGTGHNTCYYDAARETIINMESGNFDQLPDTEYDRQLDAASEKSGAQRLEKMVAGRYLGDLARLIAADCLNLEFSPAELTAETLGGILSGAPTKDGTGGLPPRQSEIMRQIAELIVVRSARLVAATFLGVLRRIDPSLEKRHTIAIDGSLYEKMPGYAAAINAALTEALDDKIKRLTIKLTPDGSGVGAAIAAAIAAKQ